MMEESQDKPPKKEKDSRKDAFLREAQAIIIAQKSWSDETRLKLRVLADRLKLPAKVFEAAMEELISDQESHSKTRWEEAYVVYLEKQFAKIPGDILTLRAEKKAIDYGRRRFELSVDACDRLIEQVAERMDKVRISETEALRHAKSEVIRLASGRYEEDEDLAEQVVTAVSDWGVSEERANQLLKLQISSNRAKRRSRRLKTLVVRGSLLVLGLASIAATIFLGQIIVKMESGQKDDSEKKSSVKIAGDNTEPQRLPVWWSPNCIEYFAVLQSIPEWETISDGLVSDRKDVRATAYSQLLDRLEKIALANEAVSEKLLLENADLQNFLIDLFLFEPEPRNAFAIANQLATKARSHGDESWNGSPDAVLQDFLVRGRFERIILRVANAAIDQPERAESLLAILSNVNPELPAMRSNYADVTRNLSRKWKLRRAENLNDYLWTWWSSDVEEKQLRFDPALVDRVLDAIGEDDKDSQFESLNIQCAIAAMDGDYATMNRSLICEKLAVAEGRQRKPGLQLILATKDQSLRSELLHALRSGLDREIDLKKHGWLEAVVISANDLGVTLEANEVQRRIRASFLLDEINGYQINEPLDELGFYEMAKTNSVAISLIENRWSFSLFDRILTTEPLNADTESFVTTPVSDLDISKVMDSKDSLELLAGLERLRFHLRNGAAISYSQARKLLTLFLESQEDALVQAWRDVMPELCRQPPFLLAISDLCAESSDKAALVSQRMNRWNELQLGIDRWDQRTTKLAAFKLLESSHNETRMQGMLSANLDWRIQAVRGQDSQFDAVSMKLLQRYELLLKLMLGHDGSLPTEMDARYSNVLLLHRTLVSAFSKRYEQTGLRRIVEVQAESKDDSAIRGLIEAEQRLSKVLVSRLSSIVEGNSIVLGAAE